MGDVGSRGGEDSDGTAGACEFREHGEMTQGSGDWIGKLVEEEKRKRKLEEGENLSVEQRNSRPNCERARRSRGKFGRGEGFRE